MSIDIYMLCAQLFKENLRRLYIKLPNAAEANEIAYHDSLVDLVPQVCSALHAVDTHIPYSFRDGQINSIM